jgi:uncharacterized protein (TIGR04255 family)
MRLPEYDRVLFKKTPLRLVLGQVRFPILPRFAEAGFLAPFHEAIRRQYPKASRENQITYNLNQKGLQTSAGDVLWRFSTRDKIWSVVLGEEAVTLEVRGYSSINEFLERFLDILEIAAKNLQIDERTRLGLRYVNELRHPDGSDLGGWRSLLTPEFVGFGASDLLDGTSEHMFQEVRIRRADGILAIRHGLMMGTVIEPPSSAPPPSGPFYLIDLDYYDNAERSLDLSQIAEQMKSYNDIQYRFFRWTLGEKLFAYMEPVNVPEH